MSPSPHPSHHLLRTKFARFASLSVAYSLALLPSPAHSQNYTWSNVEIGGGGFVSGTVFHPSEPGLVYARTDVGGIYRLDTSTNRWLPLNDQIGGLGNEFQHLGILSIGLDPSDPNRVYIATGQYAGTESWKLASRIYRSTDRGNTWAGYTTPGFKMAGNGEGRGTGERFAVDPTNGATILVGTSNDGIWRSTNYGVNWAKLPNFPATNLNYLLYAPANATGPGPARRVYAAANTLSQASLWFSDDNGETWAEVPGQPGRTAGAEMFSLMGSFDAAGVLFTTWGDQTGPSNYQTRYQVAKLAANGTTWTTITPPTGQGGFAGISADPRVAGHVVVTTIHRWWPGDEVYRSTNGGASWTATLRSTGTTISTGNSPWSNGASPHWMTDIDIDPFNSDRVIFNTGFGLFQTTNMTAASASRVWTFFNDGLEELVPLGLLSPTGGAPLISVVGDYTGFRHDNIRRSPERGRHSPGNGSNSVLAGAELAPLRMVRQNSSDTYFSTNGGSSWAGFASKPAPAVNGAGRVVFSADGNRLVWAPPGSGAYFSTNNGASWTLSTNGSTAFASNNLSVSTLAGKLGTPGAENASDTSASFNAPAGVAVGSTGIRYVADTGNHLIRKIGEDAAVTTFVGGAGVSGSTDGTGTAARLNGPTGIVVSSGSIFVADTNNHTIRKISGTGVTTTFAGSPGLTGTTNGTGAAARFNSPRGLGADSAGNLYVADTNNHVIRKISTAGVVTTFAGQAGTSGSADGTSGARFKNPQGVVVDASGNVFVADTGNHTIRKITSSGSVSTLAGTANSSGSTNGTGSAARFNAPRGITVSSNGVLHVADTGNQTIRRVTTAGVVTTVAGTAGSAGSANGLGSASSFTTPAGIASDGPGFNIYVAESGNHAIRRCSNAISLLPYADRVNSLRFYLWDGTNDTLLTSADGGVSYTVAASGLNTNISAFRTVPGKTGHIWARASGTSGLFQSTNFGASFTKLSNVAEVYQFDFGKAAPGASYPTLFLWGKINNIVGFYRSENAGSTWLRINDDLHQFGYINDMIADSRTYGRVFLGTSGRGVIVGEITTLPTAQPSQLIYADSLASGWTNASTSGVSLSSPSSVRRGNTAISLPANTASTTNQVAFTTAARSTVGYRAISFWIYGGPSSPPPALKVGGSRGGVELESYPVNVPQSVGWQRVIVPLAELGLDNIEDLTGLRIAGQNVGTAYAPAFSVDDIGFFGLEESETPVQITLANLTTTYDGTPKPVSVSTVPGGYATTVTYNGSSLPPTENGSYTVVASIDDAFATGTITGTLVIEKAEALVTLSGLSTTADGSPKTVAVTTSPAGLPVTVTYAGSSTPPSLAGNYPVVATVTDPNYTGSASGVFVLLQPSLPPTALTGWTSNIAGKVTGSSTSSPVLIPNDTTDPFSTNTLQASFGEIALVSVGDKITLTGGFQLSVAGVANQGNWFRFGLFDNRGQAPGIVNGWLGYTAMAMATPVLFERTGTGMFSTGTGATSTAVNASPTPVGATSPVGTPPVAFEQSITRIADGVLVNFLLKRTDTNETLLSFNYTDTSPNNNGSLAGSNTATTGYNPTYNTAGFAFGRSYIGTTGATAQFSNLQIAFTPSSTSNSQFISFPTPVNKTVNSAPFALTAAASSGLPVSYTFVSGPATLSGNIVTITGAGAVTIRASQAGDGTFLPAPDVERTFNVVKASATVTLSNLATTYNGSPKSVTVSTNPVGQPVEITYAGSPTAPTNAGSYAVVATINSPTYQGSASGTLVIAKAAQTLSFTAPGEQSVGTSFAPGASASSGLPVSYTVVSGPATVQGNTITISGLGPVTLRASQEGNPNYQAAPAVEHTFQAVPGSASVTLAGLETTFDGQPKPVSVTTVPADLAVEVLYDGSPTPPTAQGSYAVVATVTDLNYLGSASGTLVIAPRSFTTGVTGWRVSNSTTIAGAATNSPLLNANNGAGTSGPSTSFYAFFDSITLTNEGDALTLSGDATINAPGGVSGAGLWFRCGLYDNRDQAVTTTTGWLGYTAMCRSTSAFYELTGTANFATSLTGATARTVDATPAYAGANSPSGVVNVRFTQTITRSSSGVTVVTNIVRPGTGGGADTPLHRSTYTDTTPNNNGLLSGSQSTPTGYTPRYNAVGFVFSDQFLASTNTSSIQFNNVRTTFTPGTEASTQTLEFTPIENQPFSTTPIPLSATASSGLPVIFSVVNGPATLSGNTLTLTGVGTITVRASQPGDYTFLPATSVERSFEVTKATAGIALSGLTSTYDGSSKNVVVTTSPAGLPVVVTYNEQLSPPSAIGTYSVTATVEDANYEGSATGVLTIAAPVHTWSVSSVGTYSLSSAAQWSNSAPPASGALSTIAFLTGSTAPVGTITANQDLANPLAFHRLELNGTGPGAGTSLVRLTGQPLHPLSSNENVPSLVLNAMAGSGLTYEIAVGIQNDTGLRIQGNGSAELQISGEISGPGGLTLETLSTVTLSGNQTYTGPTLVESGTLAVTGTLSGTDSVAVGAGATLHNTGTIESPDVTILTGGRLTGHGLIRGNLTIAGEVLISGPGTFRVEGDLLNTGIIRLTGGARLEVTGTITNQALVDLIMAEQDFQGTLVNEGTFLLLADAQVPATLTLSETGVQVALFTFEGHLYQLQTSTTLQADSWTNVGEPQAGTGAPLGFTDPAGITLPKQFYRVIILP